MHRPPLRRPVEDRWLAGVAAGIARHIGVPVAGIRVVLVGLLAAGGVGAVAYALLWALVPADASAPLRLASRRSRWVTDGEIGWQLVWGVALLVLGSALLAERAGLPIQPMSVLPVALAVAGAAVVWGQLDTAERGRWLTTASGGTRDGLVRVVAGVLLSLLGVLLLVTGRLDAAALRSSVLAAVAVLGGAGLLLAPWVLRMWRELNAERTARLRANERAEVAAHLHDSVLQTLSLIQRRSNDAAEVSRLARGQERDLREWLYGAANPRDDAPPQTVAAEVRRVVADLEDAHGVPVDVVVVGDRALDARAEPLVHALREATANAVRHGRPPVSVYLEAGESGVEAYVRDRGEGFELDDVPPDRLGVRESIIGRMARVGGSATVRRVDGGGTEVALRTTSGGGLA